MKPVVHYTSASAATVGLSALLFGVVDHPNHIEGHSVSNNPDNFIRTSTIVSIDGDRIETKNTVYMKAGQE